MAILRFSHRLQPRWKWLALAVAVLALSAGLTSQPASAHQDPVGCNASGLQQFPSVNPASAVHVGDTLTYSVIYTNTDPDGAGPVQPCNISNASATITLPDGVTVINVLVGATLNVGDSISCPGGAGCAAGPYTYSVNQADESGSSVTADFHIDGTLHQSTLENQASDNDNLSSLVIHPSTLLTKSVDDNVVTAGQSVTYTYTEANDGDVVLTNPSVVDDKCAPVTYVSGDGNVNGDLDPGETWTFTCSMVINEDTTNIATGRGLDPSGANVTWTAGCAAQDPEPGVFCDADETASTSVRVVQPLVVQKTAATTYDRSWDWTIDKSADQTSLLLAQGEAPVSVNYTVMVSALSQDLNHMVNGTITVTNPVGNPSATIESVADVVSNVGAATVDCSVAFPTVLAGGDVLNCTYTVSAPDGDDELNTATVTTSGDVPGGQGTADVIFGSPTNELDECVVVNDTNPQGPQGWLVCAGDADKTAEYSVSFGNHPDANVFVECGEIDHPNTASFTTNDTQASGQDSWSVHITVECFQGCTLTQGYWKTHSDQGPAPFDGNWDNLGDVDGDGTAEQEGEMFFLSGMTWYEVFWTAPKGNAYYQLAHQYMAAYLNALGGATTTPAVDSAMAAAETFFEAYTPAAFNALGKKSSVRTDVINWAGTLGSYNEGLIGPGHCDEQSVA